MRGGGPAVRPAGGGTPCAGLLAKLVGKLTLPDLTVAYP
eukprot:COSAG02_NODE_25160_length_667_cov_0.904930_1_plen_38_part_10